MDQVDFSALALSLGLILFIFFGPKTPGEIAEDVAKALNKLSQPDASFVPLDQAVINRMTAAAVICIVLFVALTFLGAQY